MSDIFAPLRDPEPVAALSPAEVRRRGDRLRRRRTGLAVGAAVCATAVVASTALLVGDGSRSGSAPGPADPPPVDGVIPTAFDLADGLPRDFADMLADVRPRVQVCEDDVSLADRATAAQGLRHTRGADLVARGLAVYPDAGTARAVAADLLDRFEGCQRLADDRGTDWTTAVRRTSHGDQGWVVLRSRQRGATGASPTEAVHVVRVGATLLVLQQVEVHGIPVDDLATGLSMQVDALAERQLCLLTDAGCAWRSDPEVLRPDGWGELRLGMSLEEVQAVTDGGSRDEGECTTVDLGAGEAIVSASDGLVRLRVPGHVSTPDGIGAGSSRKEVHERSWGEDRREVVLVRASSTADYVFAFQGDRVSALALTAVGAGCPG